jgi:hypothetical protein
VPPVLKVLLLVLGTPEVHPDHPPLDYPCLQDFVCRTFMRIAHAAIVVSLLCGAAWCASASAEVLGSWEGESKCAVTDSPCHDEHGRYRIRADKQNPAQLNLDADKVVDGSPVFMGTLACQYHAESATLRCTGNAAKPDDWEFHVSGDTMTGTLKIGAEKTLYRRIVARKK